MSQADFAVNFFVALFALIDPLGNVPVFAAATVGAAPRERAQLAVLISLFAAGFLIFFYFTGLSLLQFFGISLPAFRIAGGVILFLLGLRMAHDDFSATFAEAGETPTGGKGYVRRRFERMIVPFAMPLLIGPGAISTAVIYASQAGPLGVAGAAAGVAVIVAVSAVTLATFLATPLISRVLGNIGLTIIVRVLGLILCAVAVQFILAGLADSTLGLIRPEAAAPYGG